MLKHQPTIEALLSVQDHFPRRQPVSVTRTTYYHSGDNSDRKMRQTGHMKDTLPSVKLVSAAYRPRKLHAGESRVDLQTSRKLCPRCGRRHHLGVPRRRLTETTRHQRHQSDLRSETMAPASTRWTHVKSKLTKSEREAEQSPEILNEQSDSTSEHRPRQAADSQQSSPATR